MTHFSKHISESEAYYSIKNGKIILSGGGQSSYNLPKPFYKFMTNNEILIEDSTLIHTRKEIDGNAFVLQEDYEFKLGSSALSLIGESYNNIDNRFVASMNGTNNKFQLYRKAYNNLDWRYSWFVELYDKNLSGNILILDIDEKNKVFTLDIEFVQIKQNIYQEYIEKLQKGIL